MKMHDAGSKADRDRAVVLNSYQEMCRFFRVPRGRRLTVREIAGMTNTQLFQAAKDLYNSQPVKKALRLSRKMGLSSPPESRLSRLKFSARRMTARLWLLLVGARKIEVPRVAAEVGLKEVNHA